MMPILGDLGFPRAYSEMKLLTRLKMDWVTGLVVFFFISTSG